MNQKLLLVDFENVQQVDLSRLDETFRIIVFVGTNQKNIPFDLVNNAQKLGSRLEWRKVEGNGTNALDFFIACQLGQVLENSKQLHCIVLSKDKGFDPLLKYLNKNGLKCKRINSLLELDPKAATAAATADEPNYKRVLDNLGKLEKKQRPRKLNTLSQHISSIFQKKITQKDIDRIIDLLFANKLISETNNTITYEF
jgi:hypothetical protein